MKQFRNKLIELTDEVISEIAKMIPGDGVTFTGELRDEIETDDITIPALPVYDSTVDVAYYEDLYRLTPTQYRTIEDPVMRDLRCLSVDDLVAICEYLEMVYFVNNY